MRFLFFVAALALALALALAALAVPAPAAASGSSAQPSARQPPAHGEIIEVNAREQRVLIKHGRIQSIGMDPMTMEFVVTDVSALARIKPGDRVRFAVAYKEGEFVASQIEVLRPAKRPRR